MNRNLSKLLQSLAGAVVLSMASLSMAATYDYDFDADENERGGATLSFGGDLTVYAGHFVGAGPSPEIERAYAYLDAGTNAGLGVCKGSVDNTAGGGAASANKCFTAGGGYAGSDDNMQENEVLGFVFDVTKKISTIGLHGADTPASGHSLLADGEKILIWTDTQGFDLLSTIGSKITLGFELTQLAIFGQSDGWYANQFKWGEGTSVNQLYVAGINAVPIPAAVWLFGSALLGLTGLRRRKVAV